MARPKSEDKRNAILSAATQVFAERGLSAATSAISAVAGIAEGTLFTYFKTKDELVNELYREIKLGLADAMMSDFPRRASVRHRMEHVWNKYLDWGLANPVERKALMQISVWGGLTEQCRAAGASAFAEIQTMTEAAVSQRIFQDIPQRFATSLMTAIAETTMEFIRQHPEDAETYRQAGFGFYWAGITCKR